VQGWDHALQPEQPVAQRHSARISTILSRQIDVVGGATNPLPPQHIKREQKMCLVLVFLAHGGGKVYGYNIAIWIQAASRRSSRTGKLQ
jgi:hypothetical protein